MIDRVVVGWLCDVMNFYQYTTQLLLASALVYLSSCASTSYLNKAQDLKPGMSKYEVIKLLGKPDMDFDSSVGSWTYSSLWWYGEPALQVVFDESRKAKAALYATANVDMGFMGWGKTKVESKSTFIFGESWHQKHIASYGGVKNQSAPKEIKKSPAPLKKQSSNSYEDKKKQLLDMYLQKEITKEEYFELRRELDKTK